MAKSVKQEVPLDQNPISVSTPTFVRVRSSSGEARYLGAIEFSDGKIVDFFSENDREIQTYIQDFLISLVDFKTLAFQKQNKDFSIRPDYSDGMISDDELSKYDYNVNI